MLLELGTVWSGGEQGWNHVTIVSRRQRGGVSHLAQLGWVSIWAWCSPKGCLGGRGAWQALLVGTGRNWGATEPSCTHSHIPALPF